MDRLWVERHLLERLEFKLEAAKLFLAADARRFVAPALSEVELLIEQIQEAEPRRALAVAGALRERGRSRHVTLGAGAPRSQSSRRRSPSIADAFVQLTSGIEALSTATV
jgi:hypothetical protein